MSDGKTHDRIGLFAGVVCFVNIDLFLGWKLGVPFILGWLLALFIFSPDTDLMPRKRIGILAFFLYPYSLFFKHRGVSHSIILGTLSRVIYILLTLLLLILILSKMGYIEFNFSIFVFALKSFVLDFSLDKPIYQMITSFYMGMFGADAVHVILDILSSFTKKLKRDVF